MVERLFLAVPWACLRFVIVVFPDHTHLLFTVFNIEFLQHLALHINTGRRFFNLTITDTVMA